MNDRTERMRLEQYRNLTALTSGVTTHQGTVTKLPASELARLVQSSITEADVVNAIRKALRAYGYRISEVSQRGGRGSGTTVGHADLSVRRDTWPRGVWIHLEVKRPVGGRLSPAQAELYEAGGTFVVRSAEEAIAAARSFGDWQEAGRG